MALRSFLLVSNRVAKSSKSFAISDEPEVLVHEPTVLSDEDHRAVLACHVFADPDPIITWYKNTLLLQKHPRYRQVSLSRVRSL